jgi:hypothetical protein
LIPPSLPNVVKSQFKCGDQGQTPHLEKISKLERAEEWISDPQTENSLASSNLLRRDNGRVGASSFLPLKVGTEHNENLQDAYPFF